MPRGAPHPMIFFEKPPSFKIVGAAPSPHLTCPPPLQLKSEAPFQEMIPTEKLEKSETVISTSVSIKNQHWKKMEEIPLERDFLTWSFQNFVRKVKQLVRKYYIT